MQFLIWIDILFCIKIESLKFNCFMENLNLCFMECVYLTACLDPENFKEFKLVKKTQLSHNVAKFRFELPTPTSVLGLPIGQHISCRLTQ